MSRSGSQIIDSQPYETDENFPQPLQSNIDEEFQKREEWSNIHITTIISLGVTVLLSIAAAWQTSLRTSACHNWATDVRASQASKALDIDLTSIPPNRLPEDEPKLKAQRLTHLVIPFHVSQEDQAIRLMEMWKYFPPCRIGGDGGGDGESDLEGLDEESKARLRDKTSYFRRNLGPGHTPLGQNISLVLFVSCGPDKNLEKRLMDSFNVLPDTVKQCFSEARVRFADLKAKEDTYLAGSRNMFERMMNSLIGITEAQYAFYMEPDCRPVRPYWLSVVDSLCRWPNSKFWMKGSIFRGSMKAITQPLVHNLFHINGNAIYNLADQGFRDFYFKRVVPYVKSNGRQGAYDTDTFIYLLDQKFYELNKDLAHLFQFSDFMQNHWHADYSISGTREGSDVTVMVHGGNPKV